MPKPIRDLIERYARDPQTVKIEQKAMTVPTVEQVYYEVDRRFKIELLTRLIDIHDLKLGIIFCNTKRMVDDLVDHLEAAGYQADRLHGDMTQAMRDRVMNKFRKSGLEFLVATDVAARGIDVDDVEVVFNYDLPYDGEDYVHRIGRTGRAGRSGRAISFVSGREMFQIRVIERYTNTRIQRARIPTEAEVEEARDNVFLGKLRATLQGGDFKPHEHFVERLVAEGFSSTDIASACVALLQSDEAAASKPSTESYERPERSDRPERGGFRDDRRDRFDDRGVGEYARDPRTGLFPPVRTTTKKQSEARATKPAQVEKPKVALKQEPPAPVDRPVTPAPQIAQPAALPPSGAKSESKPSLPKTYSDEEILASVQNAEPSAKKGSPAKSPAPWLEKKREEKKLFAKGKPSRATPKHQTRLWMNLGEAMDVKPIDIVNAVAGETGLPGKVVGTVDVRERHLFVDVDAEHANGIIAKLNRAQIKGHKVKVKVA
jgi:ATP-dependent RNA helicase DeaD